jgi:DNA-binding PadR family transcriptional regulator
MERITAILLSALKQALSEPTEQRLYRSGKLAGLFPGRAGANVEAATLALRDGLLEVTRTETKGKTTTEWVRITPKGVAHLHDQESPLELLREIRAALGTTAQGVPLWLADVRMELQNLERQIAQHAQKYLQYLDALQHRVDEALRRAAAAPPSVPNGLADRVPWASDALHYLEQRLGAGGGSCPLPELFAAIWDKHRELALPLFHDGLRILHQRRALTLLPADANVPLPEPEHALVDGDAVFYYATR